MNVRIEIDSRKLEADMQAAAKRLHTLPEQIQQNPIAMALVDYQAALRQTRRPVGATSGSYFGEQWPAWSPAYVRKDGTVVPIWGGVAKARGRGTVKGRIKSEGTGKGPGSRYRSDDLQLGARAGGLWTDWIAQKPRLENAGKTATLTSPFAYSARQFDRRKWFGAQTQILLTDSMVKRMDAYIRDLLK